jgi:hypothetical protein
MARKRASIKGRGADILFGEKAPPKKPVPELAREVDIEELPGEEAELDAELEKAFSEEVMAMEPVPPTPVTPAREPALPRAREIVSPPLEVPPSAEPRKVSVTLKVEEPLPPLAAHAPGAGGIPPTPTYPPPAMPDRRWEEAAYGPPPRRPETAPAEAAPTAPPGRPPEIKLGGHFFEHPVDVGEGAGLPTGVVPRAERVEAERAEEIPPQISREVEEGTVLRRLGRERQEALLNEMDTLVVEAAHTLSVDEEGLEKALSLLREARDITIERPRQFDQAEYNVAKVRAMLERRKTSGRWAVVYGYPVLVYEIVWCLFLLTSLLFPRLLGNFVANITRTPYEVLAAEFSMEHVLPLWYTMAWAGIGGVVGSLYSLYWHAAQLKDFDRQYLMWYIVQPIMGVILGAIVYLFLASGFITTQVLTDQAATASDAVEALSNPAMRAVHAVVAVVAGFRQRFVYEMLDRIVQALTPRPKTKTELQAEAAKEKTG